MATEENVAPTVPAATQETRNTPAIIRLEDEDAAQLKLGHEFSETAGAQPLFISEVAHLLQLQVEGKKDSQYDSINPVLKKSLEYANRFMQLKTTEQAISVRDQLSKVQPPLAQFEIAQLASLMPKEAEEAKAILPSLRDRYDDDVLNEILKNMDAWI
eukprot:GFKZ01011603.1.p1 GENE.GFKZ01011603.1~~GFKZ01011603.1.p1  ORF type:complete len:158 (+),score=23.13 GFKZ01011603.1:255-728(+)